VFLFLKLFTTTKSESSETAVADCGQKGGSTRATVMGSTGLNYCTKLENGGISSLFIHEPNLRLQTCK
jgi:hypothetical protein